MPAPIPIPALFLERMSHYLGDEYAAFASALEGEPVSGLRVNTLKIPVGKFQEMVAFPLGTPVPWCQEGFLLEGEEKPGKNPWHLAGLYYLQDPSAMAPAVLLDPQPGEFVLDLTAAPGGKTTQMAALMQGSGVLVANEIKDKRLGHLAMNVERWGAGNVVITNESPERLADHFGPIIDRVLVDAPCSGEGMFRKDMGARQDWTPEMVTGCAIRQRNILRVAAHLVRPGGQLLYSTCTFAPEEDEGVITEFVHEHPDFHVEVLPQKPGFLPGKPEWLPGADASLQGAVRLFPHQIKGDGHFACLLRREGGAGHVHGEYEALPRMGQEQQGLWATFSEDVLRAEIPTDRLRLRGERLYRVPEGMPDMGNLRVVHPGVWLGNFKKGRFEPAHPLALMLKAEDCRKVMDIQAEDPLLRKYLRGEPLPSAGEAGWVLVCVDGYGLGWGKGVQGVVKYQYPGGWM
jgi:NOL1/NOP2/sun family putative RNA methylase